MSCVPCGCTFCSENFDLNEQPGKFKSTATGCEYNVDLQHHYDAPCQYKKAIYLITCSNCDLQYIGRTKNTIRERANGHRSSSKKKKGCSQLVHRHFNPNVMKANECPSLEEESRCTFQENAKFNIIETVENDCELPDKEYYWIQRMDTNYPNGLNTAQQAPTTSCRNKTKSSSSSSSSRSSSSSSRRRRRRRSITDSGNSSSSCSSSRIKE